MNNPIISVKNLSVEYVTGIKSVQAVHNVSFEINSGEIFGLVGESGSGKSTVVQAMMRILPLLRSLAKEMYLSIMKISWLLQKPILLIFDGKKSPLLCKALSML